MILDSFSGGAADLKPRHRTSADVLEALRRDPRVSTFDMSEHAWLRAAIADLKQSKQIVDAPAAYPWCRFAILAASEPVITTELANWPIDAGIASSQL